MKGLIPFSSFSTCRILQLHLPQCLTRSLWWVMLANINWMFIFKLYFFVSSLTSWLFSTCVILTLCFSIYHYFIFAVMLSTLHMISQNYFDLAWFWLFLGHGSILISPAQKHTVRRNLTVTTKPTCKTASCWSGVLEYWSVFGLSKKYKS